MTEPIITAMFQATIRMSIIFSKKSGVKYVYQYTQIDGVNSDSMSSIPIFGIQFDHYVICIDFV